MNGFTNFEGNPVQLWFFDVGGSNSGFMGNRFLPSAHIELIQDEMCFLHFLNASSMSHTIHLHGMDVNQSNDGVQTTSMLIPPFGSFTYQLIAPFAGSYHYHCHVDTVLHYHKGMAGAVIVRPPGGRIDVAWEGGPAFDEEVLWQLNTYDLSWEGIPQSGVVTARHRPNVFLLNGRVSADAQVCPFTLIRMQVGQVGYLRVLNQAYQFARFSLGGLPFDVVASDGRPMPAPITTDTWEIGTGERYDVLFSSKSPFNALATVDYLDDYTGNVLGQVSTVIDIHNNFARLGR
jgi:FtsP/CotA-like multicopper oxidase with cupredoxin domain